MCLRNLRMAPIDRMHKKVCMQLILVHLQVRIIDCYLVEGYKIFYRIGFALLRIFVKYLRLGTSKWHGLIKSRGLVGGFMYFCTEIPVRKYTQ